MKTIKDTLLISQTKM